MASSSSCSIDRLHNVWVSIQTSSPRIALCAQDFDSDKLKNKKHWLSFTSAFFLPLAECMRQLQEYGKLKIDDQSKELLKDPLLCHRCRLPLKTMPALKAHIASCTADVASLP